VDTLACTATFAGVPVELRPREFALLVHLAREPTRVHEKQELLRAVWAYQCPGRTRTVDSHASRLRRSSPLPARTGGCARPSASATASRQSSLWRTQLETRPGKEPHAMRMRTARNRLAAAMVAKSRLVALGLAVIEARGAERHERERACRGLRYPATQS
jgi:hypothetical protein